MMWAHETVERVDGWMPLNVKIPMSCGLGVMKWKIGYCLKGFSLSRVLLAYMGAPT